MNRTITPQQFGAKGDGQADDTGALLRALNEAADINGCLRIPAGEYNFSQPLSLNAAKAKGLSIIGEGEGVTQLVAHNCSGLDLRLQQGPHNQQPRGLMMDGVGLVARGNCGRAIEVSYGAPQMTNDHNRSSVRLSNVLVESSYLGSWAEGIDIADAWNLTLDNVFVSGNSAHGVWNNMSGSGISLRRMCVNAHFSNVRTNFWATGIMVHADDYLNTEGLFFSNCSMVAVKRGLWVRGNPSVGAGRISTVNWMGGMIEARVGGVQGGSAGIHLQNVWTSLIHGCQFITETITQNIENTYGVILQDCHGVVVTGNDLNAWTHGVLTTGPCHGINVSNNTYTNTLHRVVFSPETTSSVDTGEVVV